jgi:hypothetical protein
VIFGCYIWYFADGLKDQDVGQQTMVEAMMVLLPYGCSLISMSIAMEYIKVDLGMLFAANPHPKVLRKHENITSPNRYA